MLFLSLAFVFAFGQAAGVIAGCAGEKPRSGVTARESEGKARFRFGNGTAILAFLQLNGTATQNRETSVAHTMMRGILAGRAYPMGIHREGTSYSDTG